MLPVNTRETAKEHTQIWPRAEALRNGETTYLSPKPCKNMATYGVARAAGIASIVSVRLTKII
jgi:hypothetical protein